MRARLEKLIRDAKGPAPKPSDEARERAHTAALAALVAARGGGGRRVTGTSLATLALAVALVGLGGALGLALAPGQTTDARAFAPGGPGFLPVAGWNTVVTGSEDGRVLATAANVPLRDASFRRFPHRTLARLPADGILIVASFSPRPPAGGHFRRRSLPLSLRAATVTTDRRAVRHRVRAASEGYWIDVSVYFRQTPSDELLAAADEQLARLVVPPVTIEARPFFDRGTNTYRAQLTGTIGSRAAGETVLILSKQCGRRDFYRELEGTRTTAGGSWSFLVTADHGVFLPAYFRARWRRSLSKPVVARVPISAWMRLDVRPRVTRLTIFSVQNMSRRTVYLQRRDALGRWITVRRARPRRVERGRYTATFRVNARGLTLRGFVPARTAAPCYLPGATDAAEVASGRVTMRASYGGPAGPRHLVVTGTVPSEAAGETVVLYLKGCGPAHRDYRPIFPSAETTRGGSWRWAYPDPRVDVPIYLRAWWNGIYSEPLLVRTRLPLQSRLRRGVLRVVVGTSFTGQRLAGRAVELQRKAGGDRWVLIRRASFRRIGGARFEARFRVRQRGLTVRAFVPARTAAPCYLASATKPFKR